MPACPWPPDIQYQKHATRSTSIVWYAHADHHRKISTNLRIFFSGENGHGTRSEHTDCPTGAPVRLVVLEKDTNALSKARAETRAHKITLSKLPRRSLGAHETTHPSSPAQIVRVSFHDRRVVVGSCPIYSRSSTLFSRSPQCATNHWAKAGRLEETRGLRRPVQVDLRVWFARRQIKGR